MKNQPVFYLLVLGILLVALIPAVLAETDMNPKVIYQTTFSTDPKWETNNPSTNYWDQSRGMYHFSIEPSTGMYAYYPNTGSPQYSQPLDYERGSFRLEYDVIFERIDEGATFRLGFSGSEMDPSKGPNVLSLFTNAKFGRIMWLRLVTNGNKMKEVNSQKGDTLSSGPSGYYDGPTVKYELNKTYHVTVDYDDEEALLSMKVAEKTTGQEIWGYFVTVAQELHGMDRIYIGSKGDYGMTSIYARGYLDNVRLTVPASQAAGQTTAPTFVTTPLTTLPTPLPTTIRTPGTVPAPVQETPQSPSSALVPLAALCLGALSLSVVFRKDRK